MSQPNPPLRWKPALPLLAATLVYYWYWHNFDPVIRSPSPFANDTFDFVTGLGLPWLTVAAIFRVGRWWSKVIALLAVPPLLMFSFGFLLGFGEPGLERLAEIQWSGSDVRIYRTNGGATTNWGVWLRQERYIFPGLRLVRRIDSFYPCISVNEAATDFGVVVTHSDGGWCENFPEPRREYHLKKFLYF